MLQPSIWHIIIRQNIHIFLCMYFFLWQASSMQVHPCNRTLIPGVESDCGVCIEPAEWNIWDIFWLCRLSHQLSRLCFRRFVERTSALELANFLRARCGQFQNCLVYYSTASGQLFHVNVLRTSCNQQNQSQWISVSIYLRFFSPGSRKRHKHSQPL